MPIYLSISNTSRICAYLVPYILMHQTKVLAHGSRAGNSSYIEMLEQIEKIKTAWITRDETELVIEMQYRKTEYHDYHCKYYDMWKTNPLCKKMLINNELCRKFVIIDLNEIDYAVIDAFNLGLFREIYSFENLMKIKALQDYIRVYAAQSFKEQNKDAQNKIVQFILKNHEPLFLHANDGCNSAYQVVQDNLFRRAKVLRSLYHTVEETQRANKIMQDNDSDSIPNISEEILPEEIETVLSQMFLLKQPTPN